ncbi:calponin [Metarhizium acridum]|uniref:Calponin n=2 Tax=Metarhizium acridum TaxID=92637 RepID=E9E1E0_METAQ|nr:calponin [Metarhizium acridum CQMa 102]EFY90173.1 calponin [Metarhizium acridum CQMa 102]KAG8416715.1 calponin [Metarhizium acridum]KAG8427200.1 calponin [Metarhizium acridum]
MASVTSLDKDLRKLRLDKYTPEAANEARSWIEEALGERLPSQDLLEGLKDGVALCKLVNLATPPPGIKFKKSPMPFVQMENISHFLRACQSPPLNLQQHDTFLTVDLYEQKDPAQVLQCLGAFSRAAHDADPGRFPDPIGPKSRAAGVISPQISGYASPTGLRGRGTSITSNSSSAYNSKPVLPRRTGGGDTTPTGRRSPTKSPTMTNPGSPGPVSSWSKREHEGSTAPAWNIAQYGYMGGASQGNLGISFGGMRQITSASPHVPSLADKERKRREEAERQEEEERQRRAQQEAEEEEARREEERKWEAETQRLREEERRKAAEEKRRWEEQERQWRLTEEKRRKEEQEAEARLEEERKRARGRGDARLQGQFLSQYQAEQAEADRRNSRLQKLEEELERARQREAEYERERQTRSTSRPIGEIVPNKARSRSRHRGTSPAPSTPSAVGPQRSQNRYESWTKDDERDYLQSQWSEHQKGSRESSLEPRRQESVDVEAPPALTTTPRPLPEPNVTPKPKPQSNKSPSPSPNPISSSSRPLPDPKKYAAPASASSQNRTDRFLATNTPPPQTKPHQTYSRELGATEERDGEDRRRVQSQAQTKAAGWASKSLLEREMEMERQRQQEWEEAQKETAKAARSGNGVDGIGGGIGGRWDVGQWSGYTGGDSQNRGAQGIGSGRRQIVGPRPLPGSGR